MEIKCVASLNSPVTTEYRWRQADNCPLAIAASYHSACTCYLQLVSPPVIHASTSAMNGWLQGPSKQTDMLIRTGYKMVARIRTQSHWLSLRNNVGKVRECRPSACIGCRHHTTIFVRLSPAGYQSFRQYSIKLLFLVLYLQLLFKVPGTPC